MMDLSREFYEQIGKPALEAAVPVLSGRYAAGLVGCGVQGLHQLTFLCQVRPIRTVYLYNHGSKDLGPFCRQLEAMAAPKTFTIELCPDPDTLLAKSDIVVTATPATAPLFADDPGPFRGKCLIAIGSWQPEMREIPEAIWQATQEVFLELPFACQESGDLSQPLASGALKPEGLRYFGDYLLAKGAGSPPALPHTRYFKSVGMAVFDAIAARNALPGRPGKGSGAGPGVTCLTHPAGGRQKSPPGFFEIFDLPPLTNQGVIRYPVGSENSISTRDEGNMPFLSPSQRAAVGCKAVWSELASHPGV